MRLGNTSYPTNRLIKLLDMVEKIYSDIGERPVTSEYIAEILEYGPRSGTFLQRMADLRSYGLIEGKRKNVHISKLAIMATLGSENEKNRALDKAVRNVDLWKKLFDRCGKNPIKDSFWLDLQQITEIDKITAQKHSDRVRKAYLSDIEHIIEDNSEEETLHEEIDRPESSHTEKLEGINHSDIPPSQNRTNVAGCIWVPEYSNSPIMIKDEISLQIAELYFEAIRRKILLNIDEDRDDQTVG